MLQIVCQLLVCLCFLIFLERARALPLNMDQPLEDFKKEMLDALNAKRKELGFSDDMFELAKEASADEKALNELGSLANFCPKNFRDRTPGWIPIDKFAKSRPLSLQVEYWIGNDFSIRQQNADDFTPEWKKLMNRVTRAWPFVTANADKNVVITRANCGHGAKQAAFVVLLPNYEKDKGIIALKDFRGKLDIMKKTDSFESSVPANARHRFAMDKTYERCKPTDEQKAKICDEKLLKGDNKYYEAYGAAIEEFARCVSKNLFGVFSQTGKYHEEMVAERMCGVPDLFTKEAKGMLSKNQFEKALKSSYNPFFDLSQQG